MAPARWMRTVAAGIVGEWPGRVTGAARC